MVTIYSPVEEQYVKGKCQLGRMLGTIRKRFIFASDWIWNFH